MINFSLTASFDFEYNSEFENSEFIVTLVTQLVCSYFAYLEFIECTLN